MPDHPDLRPWTITQSRHVLKDRWISVRADDCVTSAGIEIAPFYVLEYPDWVHIVALDDQNRVLMTRQYRHGSQAVSLELPCGCIDRADQSPLEAARRELLEETGCSGDFIAAGRLSPNPANHTNTIHIFLARGVKKIQAAVTDATEVIQSEFIPLKEAGRLIDAGEIQQSSHIGSLICALRRAGLFAELG